MRLIILFSIFCVSIHAAALDALIERAIAQHPSVKAIEQRLGAADDAIGSSRAFPNPELAFSVNDIQFDDPLDRSLEPMQFTALNVKQKFPWFGKRDAGTKRERARRKELFYSLESAQVKLAEAVRTSAFTVHELQSRLSVLRTYEKVTRRNVALNTAYSSTQQNRHMGIMSAELAMARVKIRIERTRSALETEKARLAYLSDAPVESVTFDTNITEPEPLERYLSALHQNRDYQTGIAVADVALAQAEVESLSGNADPFLQVGYYYREAYPDYVSFTVGAALPIYGTERTDTEAARKNALAASLHSTDIRARVASEIRSAYAAQQEAYNVYRILQFESLPQVEHMFELSEASVRSGGELFTYIELQEKKLGLDEQLIAAKARYRRADARLKALTGVIR